MDCYHCNKVIPDGYAQVEAKLPTKEEMEENEKNHIEVAGIKVVCSLCGKWFICPIEFCKPSVKYTMSAPGKKEGDNTYCSFRLSQEEDSKIDHYTFWYLYASVALVAIVKSPDTDLNRLSEITLVKEVN